MYRDLKGIKIKGGRFGDGDMVQFDNILANKVNIIYGGNGSGKTSISRAFQEYHDNPGAPDNDFKLELLASSTLSANHREGIYVFNEDFLETQVKFAGKGMKTIVMFGEQADLDKQIKELEEKIRAEKAELDKVTALLGELDEDCEYSDKTNKHPQSYQAQLKSIQETLKKDSHYLGRLKDIERKENKRLPQDIMNQIGDVAVHPDIYSVPSELLGKDEKTVSKYVYDGIQKLHQTLNQDEIRWIFSPTDTKLNPAEVIKVLSAYAENNELSEREKKLLSLLQDAESAPLVISGAQHHILDKNADICPLCHQTIDAAHRGNMAETLKRLLNEQAKQHEQDIRNALTAIVDIQMEYPTFPEHYAEDKIKVCEAAIKAVNDYHSKVRDLLNSKLQNLYAASPDVNKINPADYSALLSAYVGAYTAIENEVTAYNNEVKDAKNLYKKVLGANLYLSFLEVKSMLDIYSGMIKKATGYKTDISSRINVINGLRNQINGLESQKQNTGIAVDFINDCLKRVFLSEKRLEIRDEGSGVYKVYSNGKNVSPNRLSSGERNIIGLSYFFATLGANNPADRLYDHPMFVVLDDPISSNDAGNRMGILNLLNQKVYDLFHKTILDEFGKPREVWKVGSKVLLLSHEMKTVNSYKSIFHGYISGGQETGVHFELEDNVMNPEYGIISNEYGQHFKRIFNYANSEHPDPNESIVIGNEMRRVFEAYSNFVFNKGIEAVLTERSTYKGGHADENYERFSKLVTRVVFNTTSHTSAYSNKMEHDSEMYSPREMKNLAREMLAFILAVTPAHLKAYLREEAPIIRGWLNLTGTSV